MLNASSCEDCPSGYYAPTAQVDACLECGAGDHTKVASKATTCSSCDGGTYSEGLAVNCSVCFAGTASSSRASSCSDCDAGKRSGDGAASCESCAGGSYSATGSANCSACGGGTYSSAGASGCSACGEFRGYRHHLLVAPSSPLPPPQYSSPITHHRHMSTHPPNHYS